ncbi:MAG TPA: diacylglycerol kinase family protein [Prolixibacteraceae bacterium]|jgi:diacylglycerol kinase
MKQQKFSIHQRVRSFGYAWNGLKILFGEEHNSRIHLVAAVVVLIAGYFFQLSALEWMAIVFAIGWVFTLEILNSAIENIADFVSPAMDDHIKKIKDLSAAAVLVGALTAVVIGLIVFVPKILNLF